MTSRTIIVILAIAGLFLVLIILYHWLSRPLPMRTLVVDLGDRIEERSVHWSIGMRESYRHASGIDVSLREADGMFTLELARDGKILHQVTKKFIGQVVISPGGESVLYVTSGKFDRKTAWVGRQVGAETLHLWHAETGASTLVEGAFFAGINVGLDGKQFGVCCATYDEGKRTEVGLVIACATGKIQARIPDWDGYHLLPAGNELALTRVFTKGSESELQLRNWRNEVIASDPVTANSAWEITRDPQDPARVLIHAPGEKSAAKSVPVPRPPSK